MSETTQVDHSNPTPNHPADDVPVRAAEGLLEARQLLVAIAGHLEGGSPLISWSRELADLHATLITAAVSAKCCPQDFDAAAMRTQIHDIIASIDHWSRLHLPRPIGARRHTHTLGAVISHVAHTYAQVQWALRHGHTEQLRHEAAMHWAEVQQGYADLVADIRALRIELPTGWRGVPPVL